MNLSELFEMQKELDDRIVNSRNVNMSINEWVIGLTVAMESEIDEIRREINWKWWKDHKEIDLDRLQEEVVDVWHFLLSLSIMVDLTPEKLYEKYMEKNAVNHKRQEEGY